MSQQNQSGPHGSPWGPGNQGARPGDAAWQRPEPGEPSGYARPQGTPDAWQQPSARAPGAHPSASSVQPSPGQPQYGQPSYDRPPYGGEQHGQTQPGQPPYGQTQPGQPPYGQTQPGQPPYGQIQYGQAQYDPPQSPYGPSPYAPQQYPEQQYPGQSWNVPAQPKRPVWKLVVGIVLAVWTALAVLSTLSRLGNVLATASGRGAAYQAGTLIGLLLMIVVPGVLAWLLLRPKR